MTYVWSEQHASVGYTKLKDEQLRTVRDVLSGLDTFVSLPTGYGKLLCYAILPWASTSEHQESKHCVGSFDACKFNDKSGKSIYTNMTTHTKRHIHNSERCACTHTHTHTHIHTQNSHTYTQWSLHASKLAKKVDIQTDVE